MIKRRNATFHWGEIIRDYVISLLKTIFGVKKLINSCLQLICQLTVLFFTLLPITGLHAQINFLVGYDLGYYPNHEMSDVLEQYNDDNAWLKTEFESINIQHGLQLGVRYGVEQVRFLLHYRNSGVRLNAEGIPSGSLDPFERDIRIRNNTFGLGMETNNSRLNYGLVIEYNLHRISGETSTLTNSFDIQSDEFFSAQFYISLDFHGDRNIGFSIQPHWAIPLNGFSFDSLAQELDVSANATFKSGYFGVSFLMVNGPRY